MALGDPGNLVKPRGTQGGHDEAQDPEHYDAVVHNSAASEDDKVFVVIPEISHHHRHGPARWHPRTNSQGQVFFPKKGDACVVRLSPAHGGQVWITAWWKAKHFNDEGDARTSDADPVGDATAELTALIEAGGGGGGGDAWVVYDVGVASTHWSIPLPAGWPAGKEGNVSASDGFGRELRGDVTWFADHITIDFLAAVSGRVRIT